MDAKNGRPGLAADLTRVLYVDGAAEMLDTTPKALYQLVARRTIPFRKLGGRVIFLKDELEKFLINLPGVPLEEARENLAVRNPVTR